MKDALGKKTPPPSNSRSFSTSARSELNDSLDDFSSSGEPFQSQPPPGSPFATPTQTSPPATTTVPAREEQDYPGQFHPITPEEATLIARGLLPDPLVAHPLAQSRLQQSTGLKFPAPSTPLQQIKNVRSTKGRGTRGDPVIEQVTNLLMRHGKKSVAQRVSYPSHLPQKHTLFPQILLANPYTYT